nr:MAG TPA: hypothetical protein [Caudoviricetes sp.]
MFTFFRKCSNILLTARECLLEYFIIVFYLFECFLIYV